jgi:hypothetical protein
VLTMLAVSERTPSAFTSAPSDRVCIACVSRRRTVLPKLAEIF